MSEPCFDPTCPCCSAHTELERQYEDQIENLRVTLHDLVDALDACKSGIEGAFMMQHIHGGRYDGPTYADELVSAKSILGKESE